MIEILTTAIGTIGTLLGETERQAQERRQRKILKEAKIDSIEENSILNSISKNFNTQSLAYTNNAAFGLSDILNPDVAKGLNASSLLAEKAKALGSAKLEIVNQNKEIDLALGNNPVGGVNIGNVLAGGLTGYEIGESLKKLFKLD